MASLAWQDLNISSVIKVAYTNTGKHHRGLGSSRDLLLQLSLFLE